MVVNPVVESVVVFCVSCPDGGDVSTVVFDGGAAACGCGGGDDEVGVVVEVLFAWVASDEADVFGTGGVMPVGGMGGTPGTGMVP